MTKYDPRTRYMFHAEDIEELLMALTYGNKDSWEGAVFHAMEFRTDDDAQKVLSELSLDTTKEGARERLARHYAAPGTRDAVIAEWHAAGHYTQGETETC